MKDIQQLIKKNSQEGRYEDIFPKTFIDAVEDRESGNNLTEILSGFNMYFLSYNGSREQTRLQVPMSIRKTGLWITYVLYDKTVVTEWYAGEAIDDDSWKNLSNWRVGSNMLVGDISISSDGYWVVNGVVTTTKAQGEQGITPMLRVGSNNHLQVSYTNGSSWVDVSTNPVYTQFRINNNKLEQSVNLGQTWTIVSDYIASWFRFTGTAGSSQADNVGKIQISRDNGVTWSDLSGEFTNSLHIKGYVATIDLLPVNAVQGDIYGVGPTYAPDDVQHTNPIYQLYVKDSTGWVNNGRFTSISAGVVQELGDSETAVISQKAVCDIVGINDYPTFSENQYYKSGDVVNYEGKLYEFTAVHEKGAWIGTDAEETSMKKDLGKKDKKLEEDIGTQYVNMFVPLNIRLGKSINNKLTGNADTGNIINYTSKKVVITDYYMIPSNCKKIKISGVKSDTDLLCRFTVKPDDEEDGTCLLVSSSDTIEISDELINKPYAVFTVFRNEDPDSTPDLSNVSICFINEEKSLDYSYGRFNPNPYNTFVKEVVRYGKSINTAPPYNIFDYSTNNIVLTDYIPIPNDAIGVILHGVEAINSIYARFSKERYDRDTDTKLIEIDRTYGYVPIDIQEGFNYVVFSVYRNIPGSTPNLNNVSIRFITPENIDNFTTLFANYFDFKKVRLGKSISNAAPYDIINYNGGNIVLSEQIEIPEDAKYLFYSGIVLKNSGYIRLSETPDDTSDSAVIHFMSPTGKGIVDLSKYEGKKYVSVTCFRDSISSVYDTSNVFFGFDSVIYNENIRIGENIFNGIIASSISPKKPIVLFQMDCRGFTGTNLMAEYTEVLKKYGVDRSTYNVLPVLFNQYNMAFLRNLQRCGNEIACHTDEVINEGSPMQEAEFRSKVINWLNKMNEQGFNTRGFVNNGGTLKTSLIPIQGEYCAWAQTTANTDADKVENISDILNSEETDRLKIKRVWIESYHTNGEEEDNRIIDKVKEIIDECINQKKIVVFYAHSYKDPNSAGYTLRENVFIPILEYLKEKLDSYQVISGGTYESLNYYMQNSSITK